MGLALYAHHLVFLGNIEKQPRKPGAACLFVRRLNIAVDVDAELIAGEFFLFRGGLFGRHGDKLRDVRILIEPREEAPGG